MLEVVAVQFFSLSNRFLFAYISQTKTRCLLSFWDEPAFPQSLQDQAQLLPLPTWYWGEWRLRPRPSPSSFARAISWRRRRRPCAAEADLGQVEGFVGTLASPMVSWLASTASGGRPLC